MSKSITIWILLLLNFISIGAFAENSCDFNCTVDKHLNAIKARNFEAFLSTISTKDPITFILPNGTYSDDYVNYHKVLKGWFDDSRWTFQAKILTKTETSEMGHVLLLVDYREAYRDYHLEHYLSLIFEKQNDQWLLIHDQNTKVKGF